MGRVVLGQSNRNDFYLCEPNRTGAGGERIAVLSAVLREYKGVKEGVSQNVLFIHGLPPNSAYIYVLPHDYC